MYKYFCPYCHTEVRKEDWEEYYQCSNCKRKTLYPNRIRKEDLNESTRSCKSCRNFTYDCFCSYECPWCKKVGNLYDVSSHEGLSIVGKICKYFKPKEYEYSGLEV